MAENQVDRSRAKATPRRATKQTAPPRPARSRRRLSLPKLTAFRVVALMVVLAVLGVLVGLLVSAIPTKSYIAQRQVLIRVWSIDSLVVSGQTAAVSSSDLSDAATVMTSSDVLTRAASALDERGLSSAALSRDVTASPSATSDFVTVSASAPTREEADRRAQAVSDAFVDVVNTKVLATAQRVVDATSSASPTVRSQSDVRVRAIAIASLDAIQIYRTKGPSRSGLPVVTAMAAAGVGGLALASLLAVLLGFAAPRLRQRDDVMSALSLPAMEWSERRRAPETSHLAQELRRRAARGSIAIVPARPQDAPVAERFAEWLSAPSGETNVRENPGADRVGVRCLDAPADSLGASRVQASEFDTALLVTATGAPVDVVARSATLLERWRPMDAVVLVD